MLACPLLVAVASCDGETTSSAPVVPAAPADDASLPVIEASPLDALEPPVAFTEALADVTGAGFYGAATNSALLTGPVIGGGRTSSTSLSRSLPFRIDASENGLMLRRASVSPLSTDFSWLIAVVENRSNRLLCEVLLEGYVVYDRSGRPLEGASDFQFVTGSIGRRSENTARCIERNDRVYLLDILSLPADEVGGFAADTLSGEADGFTAETNVVEPIAYEIDDFLDVRVANRGAERVELGISDFLLIDERGAPIGAGLLSSVRLDPGEEGVLRSLGHVDLAGTASTVRVVLDYERTSDCRVFCR